MKKLELTLLYVAVLFLLMGAWGIWQERNYWQEKAMVYEQAYFHLIEVNNRLNERGK